MAAGPDVCVLREASRAMEDEAPPSLSSDVHEKLEIMSLVNMTNSVTTGFKNDERTCPFADERLEDFASELWEACGSERDGFAL